MFDDGREFQKDSRPEIHRERDSDEMYTMNVYYFLGFLKRKNGRVLEANN
jgi:hypothetical protein